MAILIGSSDFIEDALFKCLSRKDKVIEVKGERRNLEDVGYYSVKKSPAPRSTT